MPADVADAEVRAAREDEGEPGPLLTERPLLVGNPVLVAGGPLEPALLVAAWWPPSAGSLVHREVPG